MITRAGETTTNNETGKGDDLPNSSSHFAYDLNDYLRWYTRELDDVCVSAGVKLTSQLVRFKMKST